MSTLGSLTTRIRRQPWPWLALGGLLTAILFLLYLAPEEATLGSGIRSVYIHVALTWTGMAGFVLAGLLGLAVLATGSEQLLKWMQTLGWVAYGFYVAGVAMSTIASRVNWGAVFWQEPRMQAAFDSLAVATIIIVLNSWVPWVRVRGLLQAIIPAAVAWITYRAPLVLHPRNPIFSSEALGIQAAFIGLFLLVAATAGWLVWRLVKTD
ncbi:MAG: hypothetical protein KDE59_27880 [Anaerolineales bacterium]|nr:hypothetical protein [Anaerolineales bacterium]MCB8960618.1 hypothetical protein [Ardenticatenales bacterium]